MSFNQQQFLEVLKSKLNPKIQQVLKENGLVVSENEEDYDEDYDWRGHYSKTNSLINMSLFGDIKNEEEFVENNLFDQTLKELNKQFKTNISLNVEEKDTYFGGDYSNNYDLHSRMFILSQNDLSKKYFLFFMSDGSNGTFSLELVDLEKEMPKDLFLSLNDQTQKNLNFENAMSFFKLLQKYQFLIRSKNIED